MPFFGSWNAYFQLCLPTKLNWHNLLNLFCGNHCVSIMDCAQYFVNSLSTLHLFWDMMVKLNEKCQGMTHKQFIQWCYEFSSIHFLFTMHPNNFIYVVICDLHCKLSCGFTKPSEVVAHLSSGVYWVFFSFFFLRVVTSNFKSKTVWVVWVVRLFQCALSSTYQNQIS